MQAHVAARVLWFTTVKACINTVMVLSGWKKSGVFKATPKLGENPADLAPSTRLPDVDTSKSGSGSDSDAQPTPNSKEPKAEKHSRFSLHHIHDSLSKVLILLFYLHLICASIFHDHIRKLRACVVMFVVWCRVNAATVACSLCNMTWGIRVRYGPHDKHVQVTEVRKHCLPFDGTLDFWVIMGITRACFCPTCPCSLKFRHCS